MTPDERQRMRSAVEDAGLASADLDEEDMEKLWVAKYRTACRLRAATRAGLVEAGLAPGVVDAILLALGATAAGPGPASAKAAIGQPAGPPLKKVKMESTSPSELTRSTAWHKYACESASYTNPGDTLQRAAFFGFRPVALHPANIPAQLVAPEFAPIVQAAAQTAGPPPDLCPDRHGPLVAAVQRLLILASTLHKTEEALQVAFLDWHNKELALGSMTKPPSRSLGASSQTATQPRHDGMLITDRKFVMSLLECKSDTGGGEPLVQSLLYYQKYYRDGTDWESSPLHQSDALPSVVLLLEGPRLSFHAVWTLYQNRIAYTPLTPSYYLANEQGAMANLWRLVAVLGAYQQTVRELKQHYTALQALEPQRRAHMAGLRQAACLAVVEGEQVERPCTLPYSLLDEKLDLKHISFVGPCLLYAATQKFQGRERAVLIKFVEGQYGHKVHEAWHKVGVAPALYSVTPVGGGSMVMVVMEHLRTEDGWRALNEVPLEERGQQLKEAVHRALSKAHAVKLPCGSATAHGDVRGPNILVRNLEGAPEVKIIDFDWAGVDGQTLYPLLLLSPNVKWHPEVRPGGTMHQEHDRHLLDNEFLDNNKLAEVRG